MNGIQRRRENDVRGLTLVHDFGWLRAPELGFLLWPDTASSRFMASRLIQSWERRRLVIARELPEMAGKALVLAAEGVRFLAAHGIEAVSGKGIGKCLPGGWQPPATWRHDLIAAGVLAQWARQGGRVVPEWRLRRLVGPQWKLPDGLVQLPVLAGEEGKEAQWAWLEVEQARKSGPQLRAMARALNQVGTAGVGIAGVRATVPVVAYADTVNEMGHRIGHQSRVERALREAATDSFEVLFLKCSLKGMGVVGLDRRHVPIYCERALAILKRLNASGWTVDESGAFVSSYGQARAFVWENGEDGNPPWSYEVESDKSAQQGAGYVATISAAKLAVATLLARPG